MDKSIFTKVDKMLGEQDYAGLEFKNHYLLQKVSSNFFLEVEWYFFLIFKSKKKQKSWPCSIRVYN